MKKNTIKWKIFKYNLVLIISMLILIAVIFNIAIRVYIEKDLLSQLNIIASQAEKAALQQSPNFMPKPKTPKFQSQPPPDNGSIKYHFNLERSIKETLTVLNADYVLLDKDMQIITPLPDELSPQNDLSEKIVSEIKNSDISFYDTNLSFQISDSNYIAIIKPVSKKNNFGLGWLIIYSSLQKVNQLQYVINIILFIILLFSALITVLLSSFVAKKISTPFSSMNKHIRDLAERNFGNKIQLPVDDEFRELVNNINLMSEKLETHDLAQKTFLQNASHEFRTPLMSIQSYAEGIKHNVIDEATAVDIIISESQRMTKLVEDLLYLSRLDAIEEYYSQDNLNLNELIKSCINRVNIIALKKGVQINYIFENEIITFKGDEEKLSRAITNIIGNCIRYAGNNVEVTLRKNSRIEIIISDDGPGFDKNDLPNIFERFYKGTKGNYGLGLAISRSVLEKYGGNITASNGDKGAVFKIMF